MTERIAGDVVILDLRSREMTISDEGGRLLSKIRELVISGRVKILLNLLDVPYIDSGGLGELADGFKATRAANGELAFYNVQPRIRQVLVMTKLDAVIHSYESEQEALQRLRAPVD
jgi:anti-anti-sigma factor